MSKPKNAVNWFEIPVRDLDGGVHFYEAVLGVKLSRMTFGTEPHAVFPKGDSGVSGSLVQPSEQMRPGSTGGPVIYLHCDDLAAAVSQTRRLGGNVLVDPMSIAPHGDIAVVSDPEGNRIGLHTPPAA